jgi:hypothetical protein
LADLRSWCCRQGTNSRAIERITAVVQFDVGDHRMIEAFETEIAQFVVMVLEGSVAVTTVAMADHVMIDLLDHGIHGRRTCHSPAFAANRRLPLIGDCLPADQLRETSFTDGGGRTHTSLRTLDFESSASANSATSAYRKNNLTEIQNLKPQISNFSQTRSGNGWLLAAGFVPPPKWRVRQSMDSNRGRVGAKQPDLLAFRRSPRRHKRS